jgi:hypothetical protein
LSSGIFLLQKDGSLTEMGLKDYDSEDVLQSLLAKYPNLLAGDQIDEINPRKWILVSREISIPDEDTEGRWSLDHLFLDQDGVPTLIEVKRSSDTRIRREVVGQMLDYAANAAAYWDAEKIQTHYETNCENNGLSPEQVWMEKLKLEESYDEYWAKVSQNLETGKLRMIFVADEIPFELKRIVEFLNEQMRPAEVLALEIKQYTSEQHKTLIPRIYGQTSKTQTKKKGGRQPTRQWDETTLLEEVEKRHGSKALEVAKSILDWADKQNLKVWFGRGALVGNLLPILELPYSAQKGGKLWFSFFGLLTNGNVQLQFAVIKNRPIYDDLQKRKQLYANIAQSLNVTLPEGGYDKYPSFALPTLYDEAKLNHFLGIWDNYITEIRKNLSNEKTP